MSFIAYIHHLYIHAFISIYTYRGSEDFTKYCEILENIANSSRDIYIAGHSEAAYTHIVSPLAKSIFDLEIEFWNMAQP